MRSLKKRGPHVLDDLMTSYFPYIANTALCIASYADAL